ncbi:MAG TPA: putative glycoside hydrolase [Gaiellaceae bacterium]|nr:putative glycoside hydrolase [Gaiellaceae bacterium]
MRPFGVEHVRAIAAGVAIVLATAGAAFYVVGDRGTSGLEPTSQPSLPRSSQPVPGIAVLRQTADSWPAASGYRSYSDLIVGLALAGEAARQPGRSLVYFSGTDVNTRWNTGVPYPEARRHGWLLKDRSGDLLVNRNYPSNYIGDVGSPAYQQAWLAGVSRILRENGDDGIFLDDVLVDLAPLAGAEAAKYPTAQKWADAQLSFVRAVGNGLRKKGYYVLVNASAYVPGSPRASNGSSTIAWWRRLAPYVNGLADEYYQETSNGSDTLRTYGSAWYQAWGGWQRVMETTQALGKDFFGLTYGPPDDAHRMSYAKASFLLEWDGDGGAFLYQPSDRQDPWNGAWTRDVGRPEGQKRRVGVAWLRPYSGGIVLVNPDPSRSQHLELGHDYMSPSGTPVSQVTLAPTTGLILPSAR